MGLDIYVGTLTRYHAGAWKTIVQQTMGAQGISVRTVRANASPDAVTDTKVIEKAVREWRGQLAAALKSQTASSVDWTEGMGSPYFTDKPDWDGYGAVVLLAAYHAIGRPVPSGVNDKWQSDPAIAEAKARKAYRHILEPEWWLPVADDLVFVCPTLAGNRVQVGSSVRLRDQLGELNAATLSGSDADLARWRHDGPPDPPSKDLQHAARFGLAILTELSGRAIEHRLPMLLDY
ncbi:MAG TPA: hypothetical protein VGR85_13190 [Candidatus Limnocylindria bacterium]|jgi:hypothetical protein|nr:hypothetical protein [Candidatus Limnocylindria bacterium]